MEATKSNKTDASNPSVTVKFGRPELLLFMSADLTGATAYKTGLAWRRDQKNRHHQEELEWHEKVATFYSEVCHETNKHVSKIARKLKQDSENFDSDQPSTSWIENAAKTMQSGGDADNDPSSTVPIVSRWKLLGDEVVLVASIPTPIAAWVVVSAFQCALSQRNCDEFKSGADKLLAKGTCWIANIPVENRAFPKTANMPIDSAMSDQASSSDPLISTLKRVSVSIGLLKAQQYKKDPKAKSVLDATKSLLDSVQSQLQRWLAHVSQFPDVIGPAMDLGFRLTAHATPMKIQLSIDLVWLLTHSHLTSLHKWSNGLDKKDKLGAIRLGANPSAKLKGVLGGEDYPLVYAYCDANRSLDHLREVALGSSSTSAKTEFHKVHDFAEAFLAETVDKTWLNRPYIASEDFLERVVETDVKNDVLAIFGEVPAEHISFYQQSLNASKSAPST